MKKLIAGFLILESSATFNTVGYADTCRDDLPVMDCLDFIAQEACEALTEIEQESCRVTCKTCETSNCIDLLEDAGCIKLVREHAIRPCKDLDFETRFKCRATCGICQEDPVSIQLKGIRNLINLQTPAPYDEFFIPPRGDESLGSRVELTKNGDTPDDGPPVAYFDFDSYELDVNGTEFDTSDNSADDIIESVRPNYDRPIAEGDFFAKRIDLPQYLIIIICIAIGIMLWLFSWVGWTCRKCCHAQKMRDEFQIKENILNATKRMQSDPLPIPAKQLSLPGGKGFSPMDFPDEPFVKHHIPVGRYPSAGESNSSQAHLVQSETTTKSEHKSEWTDSQQTVIEKSHENSHVHNEAPRNRAPRNDDRRRENRVGGHRDEERQKRTGYGHRRDKQRDNGKRPTKEESESGLGESDNDVNRLLNYHKTLNQQSTVPNADTMMFLAKDTTLRAQQMAAEKEIPVPVPRSKKLTPEESRARDITEMIRNANNTIQHFDGEIEDISLLPVKDKRVSLGRPEVIVEQTDKQSIRSRKKRPSPLEDFAAKASYDRDNFKFERNVHLEGIHTSSQSNGLQDGVIEIKELQKLRKYNKRKEAKSMSKINAIKKRIDDIEAAAAIQSDSDLNLSDLSD